MTFPLHTHTHHLHKLHNSIEQKTILGKNPLKEVQNTFEKMRVLVQTTSCHVVVYRTEYLPLCLSTAKLICFSKEKGSNTVPHS